MWSQVWGHMTRPPGYLDRDPPELELPERDDLEEEEEEEKDEDEDGRSVFDDADGPVLESPLEEDAGLEDDFCSESLSTRA